MHPRGIHLHRATSECMRSPAEERQHNFPIQRLHPYYLAHRADTPAHLGVAMAVRMVVVTIGKIGDWAFQCLPASPRFDRIWSALHTSAGLHVLACTNPRHSFTRTTRLAQATSTCSRAQRIQSSTRTTPLTASEYEARPTVLAMRRSTVQSSTMSTDLT